MPAPELVVQLTDLHVRVGAGDQPAARALAAAVEAVVALDPAPVAVLITGDLTEHGAPAEYERVRELLAPIAAPVHPVPGNHDDRDELRAAFPGLPDGERVQYEARCGATRVVLADSQVPGRPDGALELDWIEAALHADRGPAVLAFHHAPLRAGIPQLDAMGLREEDRQGLAALLRDAPHVERVVAGHLHRTITGSLGRCAVFVCPGTCFQTLLDLRPQGRLTMVAEPPGLGIHARVDGGELVSHVQPVGDHGPPIDG